MLRMTSRLLAVGLMIATVSFTQQLAAQGNTGAKMSDYAAEFANAAGNDLGNEIVVRIDNSNDARLKKLISTPVLATQLRQKCKDAVQRMVEQETSRLLWQVTPVDDEKVRRMIISPLPRNFTLDLGGGLKWDQQVFVSWSSGRLEVSKFKPPVISRIWLAFDLPTLPHLGGGDMHIGGGTFVRSAIEP